MGLSLLEDLPESGGIFLLSGEKPVEMREQAYAAEDLLRELLARYPDLLASEQLAGAPGPWRRVKREAGVPDPGSGRGCPACAMAVQMIRLWLDDTDLPPIDLAHDEGGWGRGRWAETAVGRRSGG